MAKLVQFWNNRNKLFRAGIIWVLLLQLVRIAYWYVIQNVGFATVSAAHTVDTAFLPFFYLQGAAAVLALVGLVTEMLKKGIRKDDGSVKVADGVWLIKK